APRARYRGARPRRGAERSLAHLDRHVAKARMGRTVADAHELERLALRTGQESMELPVIGYAIAAAPEIRSERLERDSAYVTLEGASADHARRLRGEVEVLALVVERIRGRRFKEETRVDSTEEVGIWDRRRIEAPVDHSHDRDMLPAFRARRTGRPGPA